LNQIVHQRVCLLRFIQAKPHNGRNQIEKGQHNKRPKKRFKLFTCNWARASYFLTPHVDYDKTIVFFFLIGFWLSVQRDWQRQW